MEENPYKAPGEGGARQPLRWPTIIQWIVLALVVLAAIALFLPDVDEGREAARKRQSQTQSP